MKHTSNYAYSTDTGTGWFSQCGFNPFGYGVKIHVFVYRRFDLEQNQAQDEVQRERTQREKLGREKDMLTGEVFTIRQQLQVRRVCVALTP